MKFQSIDTSFVSDIDKFLEEFDGKHSKTHSQQAEIQKHQRISEMRDNPEAGDGDKQIWEDF